MVEARIMRLPGYVPVRGAGSDGASDGGGSGFLWRLGDAFELFEDQGDVLAAAGDEAMQQGGSGAGQGGEPATAPSALTRLSHKTVSCLCLSQVRLTRAHADTSSGLPYLLYCLS